MKLNYNPEQGMLTRYPAGEHVAPNGSRWLAQGGRWKRISGPTIERRKGDRATSLFVFFASMGISGAILKALGFPDIPGAFVVIMIAFGAAYAARKL